MINSQKQKFRQAWNDISKFYGKPELSKEQLRPYWHILNFLEYYEFMFLVGKHMETNSYMPKPNELINLYGKYDRRWANGLPGHDGLPMMGMTSSIPPIEDFIDINQPFESFA